MNPAPGKNIEVRCFCSREPLLALAGRDEHGPFVHTKVYKGKKLYSEMVATEGVVMLRCRDCYRWHRITIKRTVEVTEVPASMRLPVA